MKVSDILNSISDLQAENPDKVGKVLALSEDYISGIVQSSNPIFISASAINSSWTDNPPVKISNLLTASFALTTNQNIFQAYSSSYSSYANGNAVTQYTNNLTNAQVNIISDLFEALKIEGGAVSSSLTVQNDLITLKLDNEKINSLISCSLSDSEEVLAQGRLQFAKEMVSWINDGIKQKNMFYFYNPKNIKLNYSDDDNYDDSYAQLKTENVYNYFNLNYENESRLVDEKLLPGVLHQVALYHTSAPLTRVNGSFITPQISRHFAMKQLIGTDLEEYFISNNRQNPDISFSFVPNQASEGTNYFNTWLYENWKASKYISGSYTHPNGYHVIDAARTRLNNSNLHIELNNLPEYAQSVLEPYVPFYSKVSFGIPKQQWNMFSEQRTSKTIIGSLINNLYVNGEITDEAKLLVDGVYATSSVNINLLKFFNDFYNTSVQNNSNDECAENSFELKQNTAIGLNTNTEDEVYASLGFGGYNTSTYTNLPIGKNRQQTSMNDFTNILMTEEKSTFNHHLAPASDTSTYYTQFLHSSYPTNSKFYFLTKISKFYVDDGGAETLVQNFYFDLRNNILNRTPDATTFDDSVYTFFDNQIHTNKRYSYKISQLIIVPALAYGYTAADVIDINTEMCLQVGISYIPIYKLIEIPIQAQSDIVVLEHPPVRPQVQFYPILNNKNKVIIQINPSGFEEQSAPIIIEDSDVNMFDKVIESQGSTNGTVLFSSNSEESGIDKYEVYRLSRYPSSYKDFNNNKIATINNVGDYNFTLKDDIKTNQPYYYCIRSKNYRGLVSNPTNVYKITLVEDGEFFTLQQEIIENLNKENIYSRSTTKEIKRFIHVSPSEIQKASGVSIDGNASDAIVDFPLASVDNKVWGKKFKIRIRSKSSGKTLDFNITFNKNNSGEYIPE